MYTFIILIQFLQIHTHKNIKFQNLYSILHFDNCGEISSQCCKYIYMGFFICKSYFCNYKSFLLDTITNVISAFFIFFEIMKRSWIVKDESLENYQSSEIRCIYIFYHQNIKFNIDMIDILKKPRKQEYFL